MEKIESNLGDYIVVLVKGKLRALKYIARVDDDDDQYEGVFLQKINSRISSEELIVIVVEEDAASFAAEDIVLKLPSPTVIGGSAGRSSHLQFDFDFTKTNLA